MTAEEGTTNARLSRLEAKYDELAKSLGSAVQTIDRVETNQRHAEELNILRFKSLDTAVGQISQDVASVGGDLAGFMKRIEGMIDGTIETAQMRAGRETMADYLTWRKGVDNDLEAQAVRNGRIDLVARVVYGIVGGNVAVIVGAVLFLASGHHI